MHLHATATPYEFTISQDSEIRGQCLVQQTVSRGWCSRQCLYENVSLSRHFFFMCGFQCHGCVIYSWWSGFLATLSNMTTGWLDGNTNVFLKSKQSVKASGIQLYISIWVLCGSPCVAGKVSVFYRVIYTNRLLASLAYHLLFTRTQLKGRENLGAFSG